MVASKKNLELFIFTKLQEALSARLARDLNEDLALDLLQNKEALEIILKEALTREKLAGALEELGKRPGLRRKELFIEPNQLPRIPEDMSLESIGAEHRGLSGRVKLEMRSDGKLYANGIAIERVSLSHQEDMKGHRLRKELKDHHSLNACFLDVLTTHQEFIPEEWKTGYTYFWGTIFCDLRGQCFVGCLFWLDGKWRWSYEYLGHRWSVRGRAACIGAAARAASA